jgi:hypothetical protein
MATDSQTRTLPYVAFNAFTEFVGSLKELPEVPQTIAKDMMHGMSGGTQGHLFTALKSLDLIDEKGVSQPTLSALVKAHGTADWKDALTALIKEIYADTIGDLNIVSASQSQLKAKFSDQSSATRDKAVRFYVNALKEAGTKFSPLITKRKAYRFKKAEENGGGAAAKSKDKLAAEQTKQDLSNDPPGTTSFPVFLGPGREGRIVFPIDVTADDYEKFVAAIAYLKALAK